MAKILNCVGGHTVVVYSGSEFDPSIRKYRGGTPILSIPYAGFMLSALAAEREESESIIVDGVEIPTVTAAKWVSVDEVPEDCDYVIVSAMYVAACKELGRDTTKLLTIDGAVVDESGRPCGCIRLSRN